MKLRDAWANYNERSGTASSLVRQLALAGVAIIFTFRTESPSKRVPGPLVPAALLIVVALAFDLLQYVIYSAGIYKWIRGEERHMRDGAEPLEVEIGEKPSWLDNTALSMWWGKIGACVAAYVFIFYFLVKRIF